MTDTSTAETCVKWVLESSEATVEVTATLDGAGNVVFSYELVRGIADLNGFFIDINNDGGSITRIGTNSNNMNGSDTDGDRLNGFDYAAVLGTVGGNDADNTSGTVTVPLSLLNITTLAQLANAEIGIRATSVGEDRDGSVKMADTGTVCVDEPEDLCDRPLDGSSVDGYVPMQTAQITALTFTFYHVSDDPAGPYSPTPGDTSGDWYYTVTVNVPAEMGEDPDAYLTDILDLLAATDPYVDAAFAALENDNHYTKSVIVTDCHGNRENYAIELNDNGEAPDDLPWTVFNDTDHVLDAATDIAGHTEATYDLAISGDAFVFV